ncbi:MAG TPA: ABC transporter substrate-binding protein [Nevskiaceae bacterium]
MSSQKSGNSGPGPRAGASESQPRSMTRRKLLVGSAIAGAAAVAGFAPRLFAAEAGGHVTGGTDLSREIRLGYITPRSGSLGQFGQTDPYMLELVRKLFAGGVVLGGEKYDIKILDRDSQSSASRATQLADELITKHKVHLMLSTPGAQTVNPISDVFEAAHVPSIGTDCPLESFFFGRGGKVGSSNGFAWTFDYSPDNAQFGAVYIAMWNGMKTNRKVGVMYPNDADGAAFRDHLAPILEKGGYKIIDPGPYQDGTTDYATQIGLFNREDCQIFNSIPLPADFNAMWRQAAELHYAQKVIVAQIAKDCLFATQVTPLGRLGYNLATATLWTPAFPYTSPLTGLTPRQYADGYEKASGKQWTQQMGASLSLFEVAKAVLERAKDPTDHAAIRDVVPTLKMTTTIGPMDFTKGPYPSTATTPQIGGQWVKAPASSKFPLDLLIVNNDQDRKVPLQRKLQPYNLHL